MKSKLQNNQKGFTIIEVLIVLAIAGLILLIVFLAVPALQRNSRNTQYKNQIASYLGAVNEWMNNNNGNAPAATDLVAINSLAADGPIAEPTVLTTGPSGDTTAAPAIATMQIQTGMRCAATIGNTEAGTTRSVAIRYSIENSSGQPIKQCTGV